MSNFQWIAALIIQWKVEPDGNQVPESFDCHGGVYGDHNGDQISQKILGEWLSKHDRKKMALLTGKLSKGLLSIQIINQAPITPPVISGNADITKSEKTFWS